MLAAALLGVGWAPAAAADQPVIVDSESFIPDNITIGTGDTVVWVNEDDTDHTVTFDDGSFDSHPSCPPGLFGGDCMEPGDRVELTFDELGEFAYRCKIHASMIGLVVVEGPDDSSTTTTTEKATTTSSSTSSTTTTSSSTSTTTTTMRELVTSSSMAPLATSSTVATAPPSTRPPAEAPVFDPPEGVDGAGGEAAGGSSDGNGSGTVALIVALLLAVAGAGGFLLWRLRPRSRRPS